KEEFTAGQYDKAEKDYRQVLVAAPDDRLAGREIAGLYHHQGEAPEADPPLKKNTEVDPRQLQGARELCLRNPTLGGFQEARDAALTVLDKQPGGEQALLILANRV